MIKNPRLFLFFTFCFFIKLLFSYSFFSPIIRYEKHKISQNSILQLKEFPIIEESESIFIDSTQIKNDRYSINYKTGELSLLDSLKGNEIIIMYSVYPESIIKEFSFYKEIEYSDSLKIDDSANRRNRKYYSDTQLNISGNKVVSISLGNTDDFKIDQSLYLSIDGDLSKTLKIQAQLSDSESPITPEGDTKEISNLDKVYIRLYNDKYELAFGDMDLLVENTEFMNFYQKFEGLKVSYRGKNKFSGSMSISEGDNKTVEIFGQEGVQGPYYLSSNGEEAIKIVPGTEVVYLNGVKLERGIDYSIDYSDGTITFYKSQFITKQSFIRCTFQYSDEIYRKTMYSFTSDVKLTDNLSLENHFIYQKDDVDNVLQQEFTDEDYDSLTIAGDRTAWGRGVYEVEPGDGSYIREIIDNAEVFSYVGSDSIGNYVVYFTEVGEGNGSYERLSLNHYHYVGENQGSWTPKRRLTSPEKKMNYDLRMNFKNESTSWIMEALLSSYDKNSISSLDDDNNFGFASFAKFSYSPDWDKFEPKLNLSYKRLSKDLSLFADRENQTDAYELNQYAYLDTIDTQEFNSVLDFNIFDIHNSVNYRFKDYKDYANQNYVNYSVKRNQIRFFPFMRYRIMVSEQNSKDNDINKTNIELNDITLVYELKKVKLGYNYIFDKNLNRTESSTHGIKKNNYNYRFSTVNTQNFIAEIFYKYSKNYDYYLDWELSDKSSTTGGSFFVNKNRNNIQISGQRRSVKEFNGENTQSIYDMGEIIGINSLLNNGLNISYNYDLKNIKSYYKDRELQYVGEGLGVYDSTGVIVSSGDYDYVYAVIGDPDLSTEIEADLRIAMSPRHFIHKESNSILKKIQLESYLLINENSKTNEKLKLYFLSPSLVMNPESTIYGRYDIRETLWYDLVHRKILMKIQYQKEKSLDNRYQQTEKLVIDKYVSSIRFTKIYRSDFEFFYTYRSEYDSKYDSDEISQSISLDVNNRLNNNLNTTTTFEYISETGKFNQENRDYQLKSFIFNEYMNFVMSKKYRFSTQLNWRYNDQKDYQNIWDKEKKDGNIFKWSMDMGYKVSNIVSAEIKYSGNRYTDKETEHSIRMEVRADF